MDDLIEVVFKNKHGICPNCNSPMVLVTDVKQMLAVTPYGVPTKEIACIETYTNFCPKCRWVTPMEKSIDGMRPIPMRKKKEHKRFADMPIGIVEED